jgi:hypothetical protein
LWSIGLWWCERGWRILGTSAVWTNVVSYRYLTTASGTHSHFLIYHYDTSYYLVLT